MKSNYNYVRVKHNFHCLGVSVPELDFIDQELKGFQHSLIVDYNEGLTNR